MRERFCLTPPPRWREPRPHHARPTVLSKISIRLYTARRKAAQWAARTGFRDELSFWTREIALRGDHIEFVRNSFDPARMASVYPVDVIPHIARLQAEFGGKLRVLDVGCGPCSLLSLGQVEGLFDLSGVDPLAEKYRRLVSAGGFKTVGVLHQGFGEDLSALFAAESFHLVFCCNALDHTQSPGKALAEMCRVLLPGGALFLQGYSREGSANRFHGLHQHDLFLAPGGRLMCQDRRWPLRRGGRTKCISEGLPLVALSQTEESCVVKSPLRVVYSKRRSPPSLAAA